MTDVNFIIERENYTVFLQPIFLTVGFEAGKKCKNSFVLSSAE